MGRGKRAKRGEGKGAKNEKVGTRSGEGAKRDKYMRVRVKDCMRVRVKDRG